MNENAKKWVAALRSGEFQQAKGKLCWDGKFCCLGVACEIYRRETGEGQWVWAHGSGWLKFQDGDAGSSNTLTRSVADWLGISQPGGCDWQSGEYEYLKGKRTTLMEKNDSGVPFSEIADIIESEPKGLFAN